MVYGLYTCAVKSYSVMKNNKRKKAESESFSSYHKITLRPDRSLAACNWNIAFWGFPTDKQLQHLRIRCFGTLV